LAGENPNFSDLSHASRGQEYAMVERDDRAGGKMESRGAGQSHAHGESGFGETVAALGGERPALSDGGTGKTGASLGTGRMGAPSEASPGDVRPSPMQSVSLDLEPADLGPVNVRIFMMDRTVHAHIRTEHMDLGQGMLSQQQQLENKLQSSGLEMGEFKVTVDQQQLSRGDSQGSLRQESEWHPVRDETSMRGHEHDAGEPIAADPRRTRGIVSIFA
jgi:flagellar hook-length control protein FliK